MAKYTPYRVGVTSWAEARSVRKRWKAAGLPAEALEIRRVRREDRPRERPEDRTEQAPPEPAVFVAQALTDGDRPLGPPTVSHGYLRDTEAFLGVALPLTSAGPVGAVQVVAPNGRRATVGLPVMVENSGTPGAHYSGTIYIGEWDE